MNTILDILAGSVGAIMLSGLARTMPLPQDLGGNIWYKWFYDWLQFVLANTDKVGATNRKITIVAVDPGTTSNDAK
jgi:hypothetical protein